MQPSDSFLHAVPFCLSETSTHGTVEANPLAAIDAAEAIGRTAELAILADVQSRSDAMSKQAISYLHFGAARHHH